MNHETVTAKRTERRGRPCFASHASRFMAPGFTLIEVVVVLAVFMLLMGIVVAIFISIVPVQRNVLARQEFLNQEGYAQEYVSRALRTAHVDSSGNCLGTANLIYSLTHFDSGSGFYQGVKFSAADGSCEEFYFDSTDGTFKESVNGAAGQPLLSSKFQMQYARFLLNGDKSIASVSQDHLSQPRVTMLLDFAGSPQGFTSDVGIQTTISERNLNAP